MKDCFLFPLRLLKFFGLSLFCFYSLSAPSLSSELGSEALAPASKSNLAVCKFAQYSEAYAEIARQRQIDCALTLGQISVAFRNSFDNTLQSDWPRAMGVPIDGYFGGSQFLAGASVIKINPGQFSMTETARLLGFTNSDSLSAYILSVAAPALLARLALSPADIEKALAQTPGQGFMQQVTRSIEQEILLSIR